MQAERLLDLYDMLALAIFLGSWILYSYALRSPRLAYDTLSRRMDRQRALWMETLLRRDLRMVDTAIMAGLQQGTGFFASACIFVIGGCFALLGSADQIAIVASDLPMNEGMNRAVVELKLLGLILIFAHAFFKFGWAYRLFNYCSILIGAVPMRADAEADPKAAAIAIDDALAMNRIAARHFNSGLRAIFFGIAYLGWFLGPVVLIASTAAVVATLLHRQFLSDAHHAALPREPKR